MKVLLINSVCGIGSTGKIVGALAEEYAAQGHEAVIAYGRDGNVPERYQPYAHRIGSDAHVKASALRSRLLDDHGFANRAATRDFLKWAEGYDPDLLWLHNIHGYYIHVGMLFDWIKSRPHMQVKWTLHDCWAFTGHCAYFTMAGCTRWQSGCGDCPQKNTYPASMLLDRSRANFDRKRLAIFPDFIVFFCYFKCFLFIGTNSSIMFEEQQINGFNFCPKTACVVRTTIVDAK